MKCFERVLIFDGHLACVAGVEGEERGKNERGKSPPLFSSFLSFPLPPRLACYAIKSKTRSKMTPKHRRTGRSCPNFYETVENKRGSYNALT